MTYAGNAPKTSGTDDVIQLKKLEELRGAVLQRLVHSHPLSVILNDIALGLESILDDCACAILLAQDVGKVLKVAAAPNMPAIYKDAIDGIRIQVGSTSCAAAAATGNRVVAGDIAANPLWHHYRRFALKAGYASCWSDPIFGEEGQVVGTLAIYKTVADLPKPSNTQTIEYAKQFASIAIERDRMRRELIRHRTELDHLIEDRARALVERNAELEETTRRATESNKAKSRFLATMSHEIRTPLNGIVPVARILSQTNLSCEQARHVKTIQSASNALLDIVNQFLDWHRIENNMIILNTVAFDSQELLEEVGDIFCISASEKGLELSLDSDSRFSNKLIDDRTRIRQIVSNLVGNAIKFTDRGYIEIKSEITSQDEKSASIIIFVTDTSTGINPEDQMRIFSKFEQADEGTAQGSAGTGLGLAICRALAEAMQGRIELDSTYGKGSTFSLILDLPKETTANLNAEPQPPREVEDKAALKSLFVLLADDNPINTTIFQAMLARLGHTIRTASNGIAAVNLARTRNFDVILMDVHMPEMDGLEATRIIRKFRGHHGRVPILALNAGLMKDQVQQCQHAGMNDVLPKPISIDDLNIALEKHCS